MHLYRTMMPIISLLMLMGLPVLSVLADDSTSGSPAPAPTASPRIYSQAAINDLMVQIEATYGIGFASEEEWIAGSASEVMWFADGLYNIQAGLDTAAYYLHLYGGAPDDVTPVAFFRQHFDRAHLKIDRTLGITGNFAGNTLPMYEDEQIIGYVIQLAPEGLSSEFIIIHELGHVLDNLLNDVPHQAFVEVIGGEWTNDYWIPGEDFIGNENLFPRATAGPNEDFADTFGQMLMGRLSPEIAPVRYEFMLTHLPQWLESLQAVELYEP